MLPNVLGYSFIIFLIIVPLSVSNFTNKIPFFNLGSKNNWKNILEDEIRKKIEVSFKKEMIELGYL